MNRKSKIFLLTGATAITIGMAGLIGVNPIQLPKLTDSMVQPYKHNPANILDNVFEKGGITVLPFIYEEPDQTISIEKVKSEFNKAGLTIKSISTPDIVTGTKIVTNTKTYTVVIYGDVDKDGTPDTFDAQKIIKHYVNGGEDELTGIYAIAANVYNDDDEIHVFDAQRIIKFYIGTEKKLVLNEPSSTKELDKTAPVITLKGANPMEIQIGNSYVEPGATATDNYDGNVTSKIQITGTVNTNKLGSYTITYIVTDSNGNKATKTRTVKVVDNITSISMKTNPTKTNYNFGETVIDITGATIEVHMQAGASTFVNVTNTMLSSYDLGSEGTKTITVTYLGKTTSFEVKVLDKISGLEVKPDEISNNVTVISGGYQANSQEDLILGVIKQKDLDNTSILKASQLLTEKSVIATTDDTVTINDLDVKFENDSNNNILIKAKASKVGNYTMTPYIAYGDTKVKLATPINVHIVPSTIISKIELETIANGEVKYNKKQATEKKLTITNEHNEIIKVANKDITFVNISNGISVIKLDKDKYPIADTSTETIVEYLAIETTLTTEQNVSFTIKIGDKEQTISFKVGNQSVLTKSVIEVEKLNLYLEVPSSTQNVQEKDGNIYTVLPIKFLNQDNEEMNVEANKVQLNGLNVETGKLNIDLPEVEVLVNIGGTEVPMKDDSAIDVKCYAENGLDVTGSNNYVEKIGFSILLNSANKRVNLADLDGKNITLQCSGQNVTIPVKVNFKELKTLNIDFSNCDLSKNGEGNYVTELDKEFTLGKITIGQNEQPVKVDQLETTISYGDSTGIQIKYEQAANGDILIKGTASKAGVYEIIPHVGSINSKTHVGIQAVGIPTIKEVKVDTTSIQIGKTVVTPISAKNDLNLNEPIKAKDLSISVSDSLKITMLDEDEVEIIVANRPNQIVKFLKLEVKNTITSDEEVNATITLFAGAINEFTVNKTFSIYAAIPRSVKISNAVNLYETAITETVTQDGYVYSLLPVSVYADIAQTRQIKNERAMFDLNGDTTDNKIGITLPEVDVTIGGGITTIKKSMITIEFFDSSRNKVNSGEFAYIGVAIIQPQAGVTDYDKDNLNGTQIKLNYGAGLTTNIAITYVNN